jgi:RHS repeat-associated protein
MAYWPYGGERPGTNGSTTPDGREKFGTYFRDSYTSLDYADQRYYSFTWGRFQTPDPSMDNVDYSNPTSWNMYAYVNGDPVNFNDPDGTNCNSSLLSAFPGIPSGTRSALLFPKTPICPYSLKRFLLRRE